MIRVFVGCASGDDIESQVVLEYTLRKHCSQEVEITWMAQSRDPESPFYGWRTERWSTPFSGFRWAVPDLCNFEGKAIYLDSDMIVMDDIAKLWEQEFKPGKVVLAKGGQHAWRFCVSLWDCAAVRGDIPSIAEMQKNPAAHQSMIAYFANSGLVQPFEGNWNCIDGETFSSLENPAIKIIHYSAEHTQPHLKYALPRLAGEGRKHWFDGKTKPHWRADMIALFDRLLAEAIEAGFRPENYAPAEPFGEYRIVSHANYSAHQWAR